MLPWGDSGVGTLYFVLPVAPSATISSMIHAVDHFLAAVAVDVVDLHGHVVGEHAVVLAVRLADLPEDLAVEVMAVRQLTSLLVSFGPWCITWAKRMSMRPSPSRSPKRRLRPTP